MGKKATIATFGLNRRTFAVGKTQEQMLEMVMAKIESVRGYNPDLICLPELFLETGGDQFNPRWQEITEKAFGMLCQKARELNCYISASLYEQAGEAEDMRYITLYLIDRQGNVAGKYRKYHTVMVETQTHRALPGREQCVVVDTDFGRVGLQICFDIGWREAWQELEDKGAQMVIWASAYDGGFLLNTYAAHHMYYVVSSVMTDHAKIIDITGRTIAQGTRWNGLALATIDLSTGLFHTDRQSQKIDAIRARLGSGVTINTYEEENFFTVEANSPEWPLERICEEFGLMNYRDYHKEATDFQMATRERYYKD